MCQVTDIYEYEQYSKGICVQYTCVYWIVQYSMWYVLSHTLYYSKRFLNSNILIHYTTLLYYIQVAISVAVATPNGLITPIVTEPDKRGLGDINSKVYRVYMYCVYQCICVYESSVCSACVLYIIVLQILDTIIYYTIVYISYTLTLLPPLSLPGHNSYPS